MNKKDWEKIYKRLKEILDDFTNYYWDYQNGRNKKIRNEASRKVDELISEADDIISNNVEAYKLLTGSDKTTDFQRSVNYNEFLRPWYFKKDLTEFLDKIQSVIKELDS